MGCKSADDKQEVRVAETIATKGRRVLRSKSIIPNKLLRIAMFDHCLERWEENYVVERVLFEAV
jgi:hypothetical protein